MHRHGPLLGWDVSSPGTFGFGPHLPSKLSDQPLAFDGVGPACIIAPTGSGKGRDFTPHLYRPGGRHQPQG